MIIGKRFDHNDSRFRSRKNSSGILVKDLDPTALPAVAPLLALIEKAHSDNFLADSICWSVKEMFEAHNELGDTMLDRGLRHGSKLVIHCL